MEQQQLFRVVFNYMDKEELTDKTVKATKEIVLSAVNYTDAESLVMKIIPDLQEYSDDVSYEIKQQKKVQRLVLTKSLTVASELVNGLFNYYFEQEEGKVSLFGVTAEFENELDNGTKKISKEDWLVPAETSREAYDILQSILKQIDTRDFDLKNIKFDKADELFYTEYEHQAHVAQSENVGLL